MMMGCFLLVSSLYAFLLFYTKYDIHSSNIADFRLATGTGTGTGTGAGTGSVRIITVKPSWSLALPSPEIARRAPRGRRRDRPAPCISRKHSSARGEICQMR